MAKNKEDLLAYNQQQLYENISNDIGGQMAQDANKEIIESTVPSNNLKIGEAVLWEPTQHLLFPSTLIGETDSVQAISTIEAAINTTIKVNYKNKTYQYKLLTKLYETESPNYIRPNDYDALTNQKCWVLLNERIITFTNDDIVEGKLTYEHGLDYEILTIQLKDPNGIFLPASQQIKALTNKTIEIDFGGAIEAGTHTLLIKI